MKTITTTVTYRVPNWQLCNVDKFDIDATPSKQVCQFCVKERGGHRCMLYNKPLYSNGEEIQKLTQCCKATAGFPSTVEPDVAPTIPPADIMKSAIAMYKKNVKELMVQGYPRAMAEQYAEQLIFSNK